MDRGDGGGDGVPGPAGGHDACRTGGLVVCQPQRLGSESLACRGPHPAVSSSSPSLCSPCPRGNSRTLGLGFPRTGGFSGQAQNRGSGISDRAPRADSSTLRPPGSDGRKHWPRLGAGGDTVGQCGCSPSIYSYRSPAAHPGERQPGAETSPCARTSQQHPHNSQGQKQVPAPQGTDMRQNAACEPPGKYFWPQDGGKRGLSPRVDRP